MYDTDWSILNECINVENSCNIFYDILFSLISKCTPKFSKRNISGYPAWFNNDIIRNIRLKEKYRKKYIESGNIYFHELFKELRSNIKINIDLAFSNYNSSVENSITEMPSTFWNYINRLKRESRIPGVMKFKSISYDSPTTIVNTFAKYFESVYDKTVYVSSILSNDVNVQLFGDSLRIDEIMVKTAIAKISIKDTSGPDQIPAFAIRKMSQVLIEPLTIIFNKSLNCGIFPSAWKETKVCPVLKKGDRSKVTNYRPISIINYFSKRFEMCIYNLILEKVSVSLSIYQHGFISKRSTITNLLVFTQHIFDLLNDYPQVDVIYRDLTKAFDKVDHNLLMDKLSTFDLSHKLLQLIKSYLSNRLNKVNYGGHVSEPFVPTSGVPQGSNLGPILFSIYMNDLSFSLGCYHLLYADDVKLYIPISNLSSCLVLQDNLDALNNWCTNNKFELNAMKSKVLTCTRSTSIIEYSYSINDITLERVSKIKDLGVTFLPNLSFKDHINNVVNSASRTLGFLIRTCKQFNKTSTLTVLFQALIITKFDYANVIWFSGFQKYIDLINQCHKQFLKFLALKQDNVYPARGSDLSLLQKRFGVWSIDDRRKFSSVLFVFKLVRGLIDCPFILQLLPFNTPQYGLRNFTPFYLLSVLNSQSPVYRMCSLVNDCCLCSNDDNIDLFFMSFNDFVHAVQRYVNLSNS